MKRVVWILFALAALLLLPACRQETPTTDSGMELACGSRYSTLDEALCDRTYDADGVDIVIATVGEQTKQTAAGDIRVLNIQEVVHGSMNEATLVQMNDGPRLSSGKT